MKIHKTSKFRRILSVGLTLALFGIVGAYLLTRPHEAHLGIHQSAYSYTTSAGLVKAVRSSGTNVQTYGAVGDGITDDTAALKKAFSTAPAGSTLVFSAGKTYRYTDMLNITVSGLHLTGTGTLLAGNYASSAVHVQAANVVMDGGMVFKFNTAGQTRQSGGWNTMIWIDHVSGAKLSNLTVDGSPSGGILMYGASNYALTDVTVQNTLADGIHSTNGSHDGVITRPVLRNVADDGVAVVSYIGDGSQCYNITVQSPKLYGQSWGRAFTVVGGHDVTFKDVYADGSNAAAIYIAAEPSYNTYGVSNVKVLGGTLINSNSNATVDHGAILVYNQQPTQSISTVDIENLTIKNTRVGASTEARILGNGGGAVSGIQLRNITVTGGPALQFFADGAVPANAYNTLNWLYNGAKQANHQGFTPYP